VPFFASDTLTKPGKLLAEVSTIASCKATFQGGHLAPSCVETGPMPSRRCAEPVRGRHAVHGVVVHAQAQVGLVEVGGVEVVAHLHVRFIALGSTMVN
jgi:hypothetical protein